VISTTACFDAGKMVPTGPYLLGGGGGGGRRAKKDDDDEDDDDAPKKAPTKRAAAAKATKRVRKGQHSASTARGVGG